MYADGKSKICRFVFDSAGVRVPASGDITIMTDEKLKEHGLHHVDSLHELKALLAPDFPLIDGLIDEEVPYVDLIEVRDDQPDGSYRIRRWFSSPSERTAEEECEDDSVFIS